MCSVSCESDIRGTLRRNQKLKWIQTEKQSEVCSAHSLARFLMLFSFFFSPVPSHHLAVLGEEWWCLYILILCCYGSTYQHIDICLLHRTQSNNHEYLSGCLCLHKSVRERKTSTNITHTAESWEWVREASGAAYIRMVKWKETRDKDEIKVKKKKGKEESRRRTTVGRGKPMLSATLATSSGVTRGEEEEKHRKGRQMMR